MTTATYAFADTATMLRRNIVHAKRYPGMTIMLIAMPVTLLLMFNYIFGGALGQAIDNGDKYIDYIAPGMMLMVPALLVTAISVAVATDMTKGIVNRFRTMSMSHSSILTGEVLGTLIQGLLGVVLMVGISLLLGFRPNAEPLEWVAAFGLLTLVIFALNWLGAGFGMSASTPENASNTPMPVVYLPMLGSGLVPTDTMPAGVRQFAEYQPFTPFTETLRGLLMGTEIGNNGIIALAWCAAIAALGYLWSKTQFRRKTR
ncbi:ABC-2 type transport system permease protein [Nocardia transvalensis]|uniref:Transport permease protein n=1 Tax=Nocardia transvalensis TaxID=37333 RepID=A0A7W9PE45_9NOCA|nr:ABC transporter permease [Nocardia transvalensis]MBB5913988.1 ABC-2 type transport system permease protein [Nocardia transvalensis]